jgi:fructose-bisphosphate aldolase class I
MPESLNAIARALVAPGKGILAADEDNVLIGRRLESAGVGASEDSRRAYRELLFTAPGLAEHVSGAILYDETFRQSGADGTPLPQVLAQAGVLPGIKADRGMKPLALCEGETVTEGLDGLRERLAEYQAGGARFAKWRATYFVGERTPSETSIWTNAHALARYAALCQEAGVVPVVEPEVLMTGAHTLDETYRATSRMLNALFTELRDQRVELEGLLLKPNMVVPGVECPERAGVDEVADATLRCIRRHVPPAVPGIVFLSGGQSAEEATAHLNAMNTRGPHPWQLSFAFARALHMPALETWRGDAANAVAAHEALLHRARMNGLARSGGWSAGLERASRVS